jgi:outer membrane protein assembly factor BamB
VVTVLGVVASACEWRAVGFGPERRRNNAEETAFSADDVDTLGVVWSSPLPRPDAPSGTTTEPIVADGRVYVTRNLFATDGGVWVSARDAGSGAVVWDRELVAGGYTPLAWAVPNARTADGLVAGYAGQISTPQDGARCTAASVVLDPETGAGTPHVDGVMKSSPAIAGSTVVTVRHRLTEGAAGSCVNSGMNVVAKDTASGAVRWTASDPTALGPLDSWTESFLPAIGGGRVFVAWGDRVHAYALTGCGTPTCSPLWTVDLGVRVTATTPPVVTEDGHVLVVSQQGDLFALDAGNGARRWRATVDYVRNHLDFDASPSVGSAGDVVYVSTPASGKGGADELSAFATDGCGATTCPPLWTSALPGRPGNLAIAGDVVFVGAGEAVQAYDAEGCGVATCAPLVTVAVDGLPLDVTVADGKVFAATSDRILALATATP